MEIWTLEMLLAPLRPKTRGTMEGACEVSQNWKKAVMARPANESAVNRLLEIGRPCLVRGMAGVGKSLLTQLQQRHRKG